MGPEPKCALTAVRQLRSACGDVYFSPDRKVIHLEAHLAAWSGILLADSFSGYNHLYLRIPADR